MKPSEFAKNLGFNSLQEACDLMDVTPRTLTNWQTSNPDRYVAIMLGALAMRQNDIVSQIISADKV